MNTRKSILAPAHMLAPPWHTTRWFNSDAPLSIEGLRGKVVVLHAFQMLCPGCVSHGIPQTQRIYDTFGSAEIAVVGLHTVFEHHAAMQPVSLEAFLHEYRVSFPVGVDAASDGDPVPRTMAAYELRGTPALLLIDREGFLRFHAFGQAPDLAVGAAIAQLLAERAA
jgi:AhpC/TSA family